MLCCLPAFLSGAAGAETCSINMKAVNGGVSYSHTQPCSTGEQNNFSGPVKMRGRGPTREIIFTSLLNEGDEGGFRLDYQFDVVGENSARPPFRVGGKVMLRPGKQVLAASAGGWKYYLELEADSNVEKFEGEDHTVEARLKCGRSSFPVSFTYLPDEQYSAVLFKESGDTVEKFMIGLLPNSPGVDGTFGLQYTVLLKEGAEIVSSAQGKLVLSPDGEQETASAGKGCVFSAKASR